MRTHANAPSPALCESLSRVLSVAVDIALQNPTPYIYAAVQHQDLVIMRPNQDPHEPSSLSWPAWGPALAAALLIVAIGGMTTYLALKFDALRPRVGDMIVFVPNKANPDTWQLEVATTAVAGRDLSAGPCVFDPNEMSAAGGSLIVEAREEASPARFRLHWAGNHTAKTGGDCGASADLMLDRFDLQRLANAAGGFGVKPTVIQ